MAGPLAARSRANVCTSLGNRTPTPPDHAQFRILYSAARGIVGSTVPERCRICPLTVWGLTASAREKRNHQLRQWETSLTNREPDHIVTRRRTGRVKFSQDVVFMAAVSSGDEEEVERLLTLKIKPTRNCTNADGLTALPGSVRCAASGFTHNLPFTRALSKFVCIQQHTILTSCPHKQFRSPMVVSGHSNKEESGFTHACLWSPYTHRPNENHVGGCPATATWRPREAIASQAVFEQEQSI